mmetsp:Transcript_122971/g.244684  ORF Transcript_122971/g.244684 Transcript_122971/m.244684 type:complete len:130 (+) Transcript_122971:826-1215(+)
MDAGRRAPHIRQYTESGVYMTPHVHAALCGCAGGCKRCFIGGETALAASGRVNSPMPRPAHGLTLLVMAEASMRQWFAAPLPDDHAHIGPLSFLGCAGARPQQGPPTAAVTTEGPAECGLPAFGMAMPT